MLESVVERYLASVTEREFDAPLMAILQADGFFDIHQLHGAFEFGKDFIAKRIDGGVSYQYAIQSKAGDLSLGAWRPVRSQIDEARFNTIAHPRFSKELPRRVALVMTGRLTGGAAADAQEYNEHLKRRGEQPFEVWDRDRLRTSLLASPNCGLASTASGEFFSLLGMIGSGNATDTEIERHTRRWIAHNAGQIAIESAVLANHLRAAGRADLAAAVALCALRAALAQEDDDLASAARTLHASYAVGLLDQYSSAISDPRTLLAAINPNFIHASYPVICMRLGEIWGLLALAPHVDADTQTRATDAIRELVQKQPGSAHPISDHWAASLPPLVLSLGRTDLSSADRFLRTCVGWVCDAYDHGDGLAPADSPPAQEIEYLYGAWLSHFEKAKRRQSYLAAVLIDLAAALHLTETYLAAVNDFAAVEAWPTIIMANEERSAWGTRDDGVTYLGNPGYREDNISAGGPLAKHHTFVSDGNYSPWDLLAVPTVVRNRHHFSAFDALLSNPLPLQEPFRSPRA